MSVHKLFKHFYVSFTLQWTSYAYNPQARKVYWE